MTRPSLSDSAATGRCRSSPTSVDPLGGSVESSAASRSSASRSFGVASRTAIGANNGRKGLTDPPAGGGVQLLLALLDKRGWVKFRTIFVLSAAVLCG